MMAWCKFQNQQVATFPSLLMTLKIIESDEKVEETGVKETTFPEIEANVDTPVTEQDSFDMGDLLPSPPPLPSLNESICKDFPPPPFIEMMGIMTVDMGTPLEGPQADEPHPIPTQTASVVCSEGTDECKDANVCTNKLNV
uniref:Uncharacterized protein n=1 Tax=Magallana gigas TaxID=29159 RepID=A0A8W8MGT3_MAGGI